MADATDSLVVLDQLAKFHKSDTYTDLKVICRQRTWKAHRIVLAIHSPDLSKSFEQSNFNASAKLDLSAHDPELVDRLVQYIQTHDYAERATVRKTSAGSNRQHDIDEDAFDDANMHVEVSKIAVPYGLTSLKSLAVAKFESLLELWHCDMESEGLPGKSWARLLETVYGGGPATREFCIAMVKTMIETGHLREIRFAQKLIDRTAKCRAFAIDVTTQLARRKGVRQKKRKSRYDSEEEEGPYQYDSKHRCWNHGKAFWIDADQKKDGQALCTGCGGSETGDDFVVLSDEETDPE